MGLLSGTKHSFEVESTAPISTFEVSTGPDSGESVLLNNAQTLIESDTKDFTFELDPRLHNRSFEVELGSSAFNSSSPQSVAVRVCLEDVACRTLYPESSRSSTRLLASEYAINGADCAPALCTYRIRVSIAPPFTIEARIQEDLVQLHLSHGFQAIIEEGQVKLFHVPAEGTCTVQLTVFAGNAGVAAYATKAELMNSINEFSSKAHLSTAEAGELGCYAVVKGYRFSHITVKVV